MEPKKNTIESLMEQGKTNGKLTTKEITDALEEPVSYTHLTLPTIA